jgi:hypothetical protein
MLNIIDDRSPQTLKTQAWLRANGPPLEVIALLEAGLTPDWEVIQEIDPVGEASIIVMPACDDPAKPSFLFYEMNGKARVATIRNDIWESERVFATSSEAVAAITAAATPIIPSWQAHRSRQDRQVPAFTVMGL